MIISASRRTDIPALYSEWLMTRLQDGVVYVPNPRNPKRLTQVELEPSNVDCLVFWTKNPQPMLPKLSALDSMGYRYYFQFTLTPYDQKVEKRLPPKLERVEIFKRLSDKVGPQRVIWRYDPLIFSGEYTEAYHLQQFAAMCKALGGYTEQCTISFLDVYVKMKKRMKLLGFRGAEATERKRLAQGFAAIARENKLILASCSEQGDLAACGIKSAACIDVALIEQLAGYPMQVKKDVNQRAACGCCESIDIGVYDTCSLGCLYCYATTNETKAMQNAKQHNFQTPMLHGCPQGDEVVKVKKALTHKVPQLTLF